MDPGLQCYGGSLFSELRDVGGEIFLTLPMTKSRPVPRSTPIVSRTVSGGTGGRVSRRASGRASYQSGYTPPAPVTNNTYYGGMGSGCFDKSCHITVYDSDGSEHKTQISDVQKNDTVKIVDANGKIGKAVVRYVVRINLKNTYQNMVKFLDSGLLLTKTHPVRIDGKWQKPVNLVDNSRIVLCQGTTSSVYNLVLDRQQIGLVVNGIECVTFGHGIKEAWHPFYASYDVIHVIESLPNNRGFVVVNDTLKQYI